MAKKKKKQPKKKYGILMTPSGKSFEFGYYGVFHKGLHEKVATTKKQFFKLKKEGWRKGGWR